MSWTLHTSEQCLWKENVWCCQDQYCFVMLCYVFVNKKLKPQIVFQFWKSCSLIFFIVFQGCTSVHLGLVSHDEDAGVSYISSQRPQHRDVFAMIRQACIRSLSCEVWFIKTVHLFLVEFLFSCFLTILLLSFPKFVKKWVQ